MRNKIKITNDFIDEPLENLHRIPQTEDHHRELEHSKRYVITVFRIFFSTIGI